MNAYGYSYEAACKLAGVKPEASRIDGVRPVKSTIYDLPRFTAKWFGLEYSLLVSKKRHRPLTEARQMMRAYLKTHLIGLSLLTIGKATGSVDHSTVLHSIHTHSDFMDVDKVYRAAYIGYVEALRKAGFHK